MPNPVQAVLIATLITITLLVGTAVVGDIASNSDGIRVDTSDTILLGDTGEWTTIGTTAGHEETVYDSRGYAVNLTGADDSYVQSRNNVEIAEDDTWTVSAWGYVDPGRESDQMTLVSINGRVVVTYDGPNNQWTAWYYDDGGRNSYTANVSAPDQPASFAHVTARANSTHFAIFRNGTQGEAVDISTPSISDAPVSSETWDGRLEELRTFDDALTNSEIGALHSDPIGPQPGTNRTARVMFDEPGRDTQRLFYTSSELETSNVSFVDGVAGEELDGVSLWNDLTGESDYRWDTDGPRIMPVSGGSLDGAPVAYVEYEEEGAVSGVVDGWGSAVQLAALIPVLLIVLVIIGRLRGV